MAPCRYLDLIQRSGALYERPDPPMHTTGRDLPQRTEHAARMTNFPNHEICAALALVCHSQKGTRLS
jgi:hypothetical protein